jgi:regulator of sirC expression with transglutaminase-like and TPR domain
MTRTLATDLFREMVARPPEQIDLAAAALLIALDQYPRLNMPGYTGQIDAFAERTSARLAHAAAKRPMEAIEAINRQLFEIEGFRGNQEDYYDPRNSFLNDVIDRRTGIPITLSLLYMEVGRRIGLKVEGVGMPGHFIVKCKHDGMDIFIDPFAQGEILLEEGCRRKLAELHGKGFQFDRSFLEPVNHRQILTRMLHNLKGIFWNQRNYAKALGIIEKVLIINPSAVEEFRDRGVAHHHLNDLSSAVKDWSRYLELRPGASDTAEVKKSLKTAAQALAIRN